MNQKSGNKKQHNLAENWEDSNLRQAFILYKQQLEVPTWVWEAICTAASQIEGEQAASASGSRPRFVQRLRKIFFRSAG
jgi:hypothetical protein